MKPRWLLNSIIVLLISSASLAEAHSIQAIKNGKALLLLDGSPVQIGDIFQVLDGSDKELGQIQVRQIKENRAIAYIVKGELTAVPESYKLIAQEKNALTPLTSPDSPPNSTPVILQSKGYYGGLSYNQMQVELTTATTLNLTGISFNFGAFYERALSPNIQVLGRAGYEGLKAQGSLSSNACEGSNSCDIDIGYLNADAIAKYTIHHPKQNWWLGGGLGFLVPVLKSSNVIDTGKMTLIEKIILAAGTQWSQSTNTYIPVQIEYDIQPSNNVVSTQQLILRVGYGTQF